MSRLREKSESQRRGRGSRWVLVGVLLALAAILATSTVRSAEAATQTFAATADAYVSAAQQGANFGTVQTLNADASPVVRSYVRFTVANVSGTVSRATLRLYTRSRSSRGVEIRGASSTWSETGITFANAPAPSNTVTRTSGSFSSGRWISLDVTPLVAGNGTVTFALTTRATKVVSLASREAGGSVDPELVVETGTVQPPPPSGGDAVIAGAGDIATPSGKQAATAAVLSAINPAAVFTLGDNAYGDGTLAQYQSYYEPSWGAFKAKTYPTPGNHDYHTSGASGYFSYFGSRAPAPYYAWNIGGWRFYALNSEIPHDAGSAQIAWLKQDLAANPRQCVGAYWHKPLFSSGRHGNETSIRPFWDALYAANADLVLVGHDHTYERFAPQTPAGQPDAARGIREFVVGTGGNQTLYDFTSVQPNSQVRNNSTWGVLRLTLHTSSYDWRFQPVAGQSFTDTGTQACH